MKKLVFITNLNNIVNSNDFECKDLIENLEKIRVQENCEIIYFCIFDYTSNQKLMLESARKIAGNVHNEKLYCAKLCNSDIYPKNVIKLYYNKFNKEDEIIKYSIELRKYDELEIIIADNLNYTKIKNNFNYNGIYPFSFISNTNSLNDVNKYLESILNCKKKEYKPNL